MPIKEGIEYGVNEALTNLRSKPISTTPDLPLATRINLLKDKDPKRYRENMQRLIQAEKDGNEKARKLLGEIGEDAGRSRRGYEWLGTAMTVAPMLPVAGSVFNAVKSFATDPINIEVAKTVGKNVLQGMFDYTLADGAVRTATGKDIMTNVNNSVKHVFGDNEYTDFATQYVTPMAPIPVFGTGNFGKNIMTTGKNVYNKARNVIVDTAENYIINRAFKNGKLYYGIPTIFDKAYHQSSSPITKFKFPFKERWDVINHGADPNAAFFSLGRPADKGFLSDRPFVNEFTVYSERPLHQVGEIKGVTKNSIRNKIVEKARKEGADAIVFENIADNQLKNQNILMALEKANINHVRTSAKNWSKLTDDQWNLLYNKAISDGNSEEVQRLRDLHFAAKTPNNVFVNDGSPLINFHGSPNDFNEFSLAMFGQTDLGDNGVGFYFSPDENYAKLYGKTRPFYLYAKTPYIGKHSVFLNRGKNYTVQYLIDRNRIAMDRDAERSIKHMLDQQQNNTTSIMYDKLGITENTPEHIIRERVKSLYDKRHKEFIESLGNLDEADSYMSKSENVLWNDKHIKLVNPITYDDAGNIIPLSKRDDFTNSDIRYAIAPLIGLSTIGKTKQAE